MRCSNCGVDTPGPARFCSNCGRALQVPPGPPAPPQDDILTTLIPARNTCALVGDYLGIFALIPCLRFPLGLDAVPLGIAGLVKAARDPSSKGKVHAWVAIICGGIGVLLWGGIWIVAVVAGAFAS